MNVQNIALLTSSSTAATSSGMNRKQINVRLDDDVLAAIDDIRAMSRPIPSSSEVIRAAILKYRDALRQKIDAQERRERKA